MSGDQQQEQVQEQPDTSVPSAERQAELEAAYEKQKDTNAPYAGVEINTLGEIYWIMQQRRWSGESFLPRETPRVNLSGAFLRYVNLSKALLREANLSETHLRAVNLSRATLDRANLSGAEIWEANLSEANLRGANLSGASCIDANLSGADLYEADLSEADLSAANLSRASCIDANLSGATLIETNLSKADLTDIIFSSRKLGGVSLYQAQLEDTNLSTVQWERLPILGDEFSNSWWWWLLFSRFVGWIAHFDEHRNAARAYQRLSKALRDQNLNDDADRYAYRAQICRRRMLFRQSLNPTKLGQYLFSHILNLVAGYGYKPERTLFWYLVTVLGFALAYMHFGTYQGQPFRFDGALVFSLTSFHGRGFFPGGLSLYDPITKIAASEAVVGLFIEISFIATFTQRFFAR